MEPKKKRDSWDIEETKYFLDLVRGRKVMKNLGGKRFRAEQIFSHLQPLMQERGYVKTSKQMQMRFKTLRMQYNQCKKSLGKSGAGNCRIRFVFFDQMEELLGDRPIASQKGIDSTELDYGEEGNTFDRNMYDNFPDERDGATPGCSRADAPLMPSQEDSNDIVSFEGYDDRLSSPKRSGADIPETNSQQSRAVNSKCATKKKSRQSFQNVMYNYASITKENAKELQNEVLQTQQTFLRNMMKEQREFETQLLQQMLDGHKKILGDLTSQLLNGLKTFSQSPPGSIRVSSPMSSNDSCYGSVSPSPSPPVRNCTSPLVRFACDTTNSRPVRVILRPLSAQPASLAERNRTTFSDPLRLVRTSTPVSAHNSRQLSVPASTTVLYPTDPSSFSDISQINNQPIIALDPGMSIANRIKPSPYPTCEDPRTDP